MSDGCSFDTKTKINYSPKDARKGFMCRRISLSVAKERKAICVLLDREIYMPRRRPVIKREIKIM